MGVLRRTQLAISGQLTHAGLLQICAIVALALHWQIGKAEWVLNNTLDLMKTRDYLRLR